MKKNQGVSMIEVVIVMIILVLIAGFAIFNGSNTVGKAEATELYTEMTSMKNAVNGVMLQKELEDGDDEWLKDYYDEVGEKEGWYLIYGMDQKDNKYEDSDVRKKINMDTIKRSYQVNYETGEVVLNEAVNVLGNSVRTYESLRAIVESEKI